MNSTMPKLTLDLIKDKIGEPTNYDVHFIEDKEIGHSYYHLLVFGNLKLHIAEYLDGEYYINTLIGKGFMYDSLEEAIVKINELIK